MRADRLRLLDALDQTRFITEFASRGKDAFLNDVLVQSAILHRLTLLGEACRTVSSELRGAHPEIPWAQIIAFRNVVVHEYFGLDSELAWEIVVGHIETLGAALQKIIDAISE